MREAVLLHLVAALPKKLSNLIAQWIGKLLGRLVRNQVAEYIGKFIGDFAAYILVPSLGVFLCGLVANLFLKPSAKPMVPAFAILSSQVLVLCLSLFLLNEWGVAWDILILVVGLIWLATQPSLGAVILLTIYQSATFFRSLAVFSSIEDPEVSKSLLVAMAFKVLAVILLFWGLKKVKSHHAAT